MASAGKRHVDDDGDGDLKVKKCDEIDGDRSLTKARLRSMQERGQKLERLHQNMSVCGGGRAFARGGGTVDSPMARKKLSSAAGVCARDSTPMSLRSGSAPHGQRKTLTAKTRRKSCAHSMRVRRRCGASGLSVGSLAEPAAS